MRAPLSGKADIRRWLRRGQIGWAELPQAIARRKCRNSANHAPATKKTEKPGHVPVFFVPAIHSFDVRFAPSSGNSAKLVEKVR